MIRCLDCCIIAVRWQCLSILKLDCVALQSCWGCPLSNRRYRSVASFLSVRIILSLSQAIQNPAFISSCYLAPFLRVCAKRSWATNKTSRFSSYHYTIRETRTSLHSILWHTSPSYSSSVYHKRSSFLFLCFLRGFMGASFSWFFLAFHALLSRHPLLGASLARDRKRIFKCNRF